MKKTTKKPIYAVGLQFYYDKCSPSLDVELKEHRKFVKTLPLKNVMATWWSVKGSEGKKNVTVLDNLVFHLLFETRADWQKASKVMDRDERFHYEPVKNPEINKRYRRYGFTTNEKVRVGK